MDWSTFCNSDELPDKLDLELLNPSNWVTEKMEAYWFCVWLFCRNIGQFTFSLECLELYNQDKVCVLQIKSILSQAPVKFYDLTWLFAFLFHWNWFLTVSPDIPIVWWWDVTGCAETEDCSAGPHLAWPHNFSTPILNSDQLRLSRQKIARSTWCPTKNFTLFWRAVAPSKLGLFLNVSGVSESSWPKLSNEYWNFVIT